MNDPRWRGWLVAAAIFILGVGVGGAGMAWAGVRVFRHALQNPGNPRLAERAANRISADLTKNLHLTPEESTEVHAILSQTAATLKTVRTQAASQAGKEWRSAVRRIAATLPREKRPEFYRILARRYERLGLSAPLASDPEP